MPRPKSAKLFRRVALRLSAHDAEIFDHYNVNELSDLMGKALNTLFPHAEIGVIAPSILRPKESATNTIARFSIKGTTIRCLYPEKVEDFRKLAKSLYYEWDAPFWKRTFKNESIVCDRAAEFCYRTLELGIPVQIEYTGVRDKVISGKFQIEPMRLIKLMVEGVYQGWLAVSWPRGEDFYAKAISLTAAKYTDGRVIVPPEQFAEIEDFAETEGFEFSETAKNAIEEAKKLKEIELLIDVRPIAKRQAKKRRDSTPTIPNHLKDDTP